MKLTVTDNFPEVTRKLIAQQKQGRFAAAVALTKSAQDVKVGEREEMRQVFDRPTPYTLNALFLKGARKDDLEAQVWVKDDRAGSGTPATKYLLPQIRGGARQQKAFEKALIAHGLMRPGMQAVPTTAIKLDQYGNVPRKTLTQILSQLRVQMTAGYESRATGSKRSNRSIRKQGVEYFALPRPHGKLAPGIYGRYTFAHGSSVKPMFIFVSTARYRSRFHFFDVAERIFRAVFPNHFAEAWRKAMETAR